MSCRGCWSLMLGSCSVSTPTVLLLQASIAEATLARASAWELDSLPICWTSALSNYERSSFAWARYAAILSSQAW
ncbi:hypothetical protein AAC387_Pa07g2449 [Persea americana]